MAPKAATLRATILSRYKLSATVHFHSKNIFDWSNNTVPRDGCRSGFWREEWNCGRTNTAALGTGGPL